MTQTAPPRSLPLKELKPNPLLRLVDDARFLVDIRRRGSYPPGPDDFSLSRLLEATRNPLPMLLSLYEEYGPIFSVRVLHQRLVFMIGPGANQFISVTHPENFHWRESGFGEMIPLLGDGLLTIDDAYHDRAREIMMPAFHREQVAASVEAMVAEATPAIERLRPGQVIDVDAWIRNLAMRIAMRALLGLDPDEAGKGAAAAEHFKRALSFYGIDLPLRILRGPGSPWSKMTRSRAVLDEIVYAEIADRRRSFDAGRTDILNLLLAARDEAGEGFTDKEIRDQVMTLMFAGHDTAASTLTFMMHELARHPDVREKLCEEQDRVLGSDPPEIDRLEREMPYLDMVLDEVLRLYPPAWLGPRRAVRDFEWGGHSVFRGTHVSYSSWASHRLPEVFPEPEAFIPERFTRERKAALPRGAYVPFGAGRRICIGKRFGQTEVKLVATMLLQKLRLEAMPGRTMIVRPAGTISPMGGLPMRVSPRE